MNVTDIAPDGERIEALLESVFAMSAYDFGQPVPITDAGDALDEIASAVEVLRHQMATTTVPAHQLRSLLDAMPQIIFVTDRFGTVERANRAAVTLFAEHLVGRSIQSLIGTHPNVGLYPSDPWGSPIQFKWMTRDAAGNLVRHVTFTVTQVRTRFDDLSGYLTIGVDTTAQTKVEEELRRATKIAESHADARASFLAATSHELRTPLNAIVAGVELLASESPNKESNELIQLILDSSNHLRSLMSTVLDLSRIDAGELVLTPHPTNPTELVQSCVSMVAKRANAKGLRLSFSGNVAPSLRVSVDEARTRQIVLNLVSNAVQYTTTGAIEVELFFDNEVLTIVVEDTGPGMSHEVIERIFEPFYREDAGASAQRGTGLGLAVARRLARAMQGDIVVDSVVGRGSRFVATVDAPACRVALERRPPGAGPRSTPYQGLRALVVDDNATNVMVTRIFMERLGFVVDTCFNGQEAVEAVLNSDFAVVLMDCEMPVMRGEDACRVIRQSTDERVRETVVVALTAHAFATQRDACRDAGMDGYLTKPLDLASLTGELSRVIRAPSLRGLAR